MNLRTQSRMTWITLVACILVALMPASGFVLCLGHDGHVGLGPVQASRAGDAQTKTCPCVADLSEHPGEEQDDDDHPPCRDLEFDESPLVFSHGGGANLDVDGSVDLPEFSPFPSLVEIPWRTIPVDEAGSLRVRPPGDLPSLALIERRTVVLLV
jgi:hypothetical protein